MGKYNTTVKTKTNVATTHEGGQGYKYDSVNELISLLATGVNNTYYETMQTREDRLSKLIGEVVKQRGVEFTAKALVYARSKMGQRSVTHFGAVALAQYLNGSQIGKYIYSKFNRKNEVGGVVYRLDDMLEMIAAYTALNPGKRLPNAMSKGFRSALENADEYELAKYQASSKTVSLVDAFNLLHPRPSNEKMAGVFKKLMIGELKQFNTVEDKNTKAGQEVAAKVKSGELSKDEADAVLAESKNQNFNELLKSGKIGYKSLVMNLRNILKVGDSDTVTLAADMLINAEAIKKSLIQPFEIDVAAEIIVSEGVGTGPLRTKILGALDKAFELSIPNLAEVFHGTTAVVFDTSGSMSSAISLDSKSRNGSKSALEKAAVVAAAFSKGVGADVYHFADSCTGINYNPLDTFNTLKQRFISMQGKVGYGTSFNSIISTIGNKRYTRIIVISDMQGKDSFNHSKLDGNPYIYSIDMCGYGTTMANPKNPKVFALYGYSAEMVRVATQMEIDPKTLIKEIEAIRLY
jgi:60 kDa SS-A/Ro ribonucleoprotein